MPGRIVEQLITPFVVLNPIDAIPILLSATARLDERDRQKTVFIAVFVAMLVLLLFLYCGQYVLEAMEISIPAFQIAGAAVLFLFALQMIFTGRQVGAVPGPSHSSRDRDLSVAMPAIASPGALLAVVLLTDNNRFSLAEERPDRRSHRSSAGGRADRLLLAVVFSAISAKPASWSSRSWTVLVAYSVRSAGWRGRGVRPRRH